MADSIPVPEVEVADVWRLLDERVKPLEPERVPLDKALGRILREDIRATADQPPFDRSAMDGYAFVPSSAPGNFHLYRIIGSIKAGEVAERAPGPGEALRVFTGAELPAPGLAVLMQEEARIEGDHLCVEREVSSGENVRRCGSDARRGDILLPKERRLGAVSLAVLASDGQVKPLVAAAPRVAHATTGDEIVPPESTPGAGQIRNSNQILIRSLLQSVIPSRNIHQEHWGDDPVAAAARLAAEPFANVDLILISGGASVGDHDYTARVLEEAGFELPVRKINSRPGRPLIVGFRGRQIVFGLPGNPVSHYVCFHLMVNYAVARLRGVPMPEWHPLPLAGPLPNCFNRRPTYWPAAMETDRVRNTRVVRPLAWNNSGHLAALLHAQVLFCVPPETKELPAGSPVNSFPVYFFG